MKARNTLPLALLTALVAWGLIACSTPISSTGTVRTSSRTVSVSLDPASRDLSSHGTVASVSVDILNASLVSIGSADLTKDPVTHVWSGDVTLSGSYSGPATVVAHAKDGAVIPIYSGYTKVASIESETHLTVTLSAGAFAGIVRTLPLPGGVTLGDLGYPAIDQGYLYVPDMALTDLDDTTVGGLWKIKTDGSTAQKLFLTNGGSRVVLTDVAAVACDGTNLFVTSRYVHKVWSAALSGVISVADGLEAPATLIGGSMDVSQPMGLATDGTSLFVATDGDHKFAYRNAGVWKNIDMGMEADGLALGGQTAYVSSWVTGQIKKVDLSGATPVKSDFLGTDGGATTSEESVDGTGTSALFWRPYGMVVQGDFLYICDASGRIRKADVSSGVVTSLAGAGAGTYQAGPSGDGVGDVAIFNIPGGLTTDGTHLYVTDSRTPDNEESSSRIAVIE